MIELKSKFALSEHRMDELEREYEASRADAGNQSRLEELNFQLSGLIGQNNQNILREYTDRLIARYNADSDWFYQKGVEDAHNLSRGKKSVSNRTMKI